MVREGRRGASRVQGRALAAVRPLGTAALSLALSGGLAPVCGARASPNPAETEVYEPVPPVVTPGAREGEAPSDAIVLFDGRDLLEWVNARDGAPASWFVRGGELTVNKAAGNIETKRTFKSYQLHIEWRIPSDITGSGQFRGNSGVFLGSTDGWDGGYELQILDSYRNPTYVNGQAASIYKQAAPLVNASRPPGEWQSYDVVWRAPSFKPDGALQEPARVTVLHNGVLVQNDFVLRGQTVYAGKPAYAAHGALPIKLQAHGDPSPAISFRNIWIRPLAPPLDANRRDPPSP